MASYVCGNAIESCINGSSPDWDTNVIKAVLMLSSYSEDKEETSMSTPRSSVAAGADDITITASAASASGGSIVCEATNPTFTTVTTGQAVDAVIVFSYITDDAGSIPWAKCDFTELDTNGSDVEVTFSTSPNAVFTIAY